MFIITLACGVLSGNYNAYYVKKTVKNTRELYALEAGCDFICAVALFLLGGCSFRGSLYSVLLGILFGVFTMSNAILNAKAIKIGPYGYTKVIVSLSTAITALSGAIFWKESLSIFKILGILLMLVCFFFAIDTENDTEKKANIKWVLLCLFCLSLCALIGLTQKIHQTSAYKNELMPFLIVAFLTSSVISLFAYAFQSKKAGAKLIESKSAKARFYFFSVLLVCGIGIAGNNALNLYLSGVVDTAIFFPIVNGIPLLASLLVSFIVFKEKLKRRQWMGLVIGIVAIVCLFL